MAKPINRGSKTSKASVENTNEEVNMNVAEEEETTVETTVEETAEDTGVTIEGVDEEEEVKPTPVPPKSVRIKMAKDHKCSIGGTFYNLEKDKTYVVPENVKRILGSVGLLLPL